jgi:hypothetical protein
MKIVTELMFLGAETKVSKAGSSYLIAKFVERETTAVFEFFVSAESLELVTKLASTNPFSDVKCKLAIVSSQGKATVRLEGVEI